MARNTQNRRGCGEAIPFEVAVINLSQTDLHPWDFDSEQPRVASKISSFSLLFQEFQVRCQFWQAVFVYIKEKKGKSPWLDFLWIKNSKYIVKRFLQRRLFRFSPIDNLISLSLGKIRPPVCRWQIFDSLLAILQIHTAFSLDFQELEAF